MPIIIICIAVVILLLFLKPKEWKREKTDTTVQEFMNVIRIEDRYLYTKDNYIITYLNVSSMREDLFSTAEKKRLTNQMTVELSQITVPFQILAVSRPVDIVPLLSQYESKLQETTDPIRKRLLRDEIRQMTAFAQDGEITERQFYIKLWLPVQDGIENTMKKRVQDMMNHIEACGLNCEWLLKSDIIKLCNLIHNPAYTIGEIAEDSFLEIPVLREEVRAE